MHKPPVGRSASMLHQVLIVTHRTGWSLRLRYCSSVTQVYSRPLSSACQVRSVASFPTSILCHPASGLVVVSWNLARYWANPNKRCTPGTSVGLGMSTIAFTLVGSMLSPSDVATCPMNQTSSCLSLNLSTFSLTPRSSHRCRNEWSRLSWSTFASLTVLP